MTEQTEHINEVMQVLIYWAIKENLNIYQGYYVWGWLYVCNFFFYKICMRGGGGE